MSTEIVILIIAIGFTVSGSSFVMIRRASRTLGHKELGKLNAIQQRLNRHVAVMKPLDLHLIKHK